MDALWPADSLPRCATCCLPHFKSAAGETFLNGTSLFFGNQDLETTEYLERRLGKTYVQQFSRSDPGYDAAVKGGATGSSYSMNLHPVLTGREVAELFKREDPSCRCLAFTGAHGPMILQRAAYDKHPLFKGIFDAHR